MDTSYTLPPDFIARSVFDAYSSTGYKPSNPSQFTVLAAFFLYRSSTSHSSDTAKFKIISLGTGTKCLPNSQLPLHGEALHDSHAEIIARRGAIRWFLEEIQRMSHSNSASSDWLSKTSEGAYTLQSGAHVGMYISTLPCKYLKTFFLLKVKANALSRIRRRRRIDPLPCCRATRRWDGRSEGLCISPSRRPDRRRTRPRQLRPHRRPTHEAWSRRRSADDVDVLQ